MITLLLSLVSVAISVESIRLSIRASRRIDRASRLSAGEKEWARSAPQRRGRPT